jgi:hypothetical protein
MRTDHNGALVFVAACAVAAIGLIVWQDWWMLSIAGGGAAVWLLTSRQVSTSRALVVGAAIGGSVLLVLAGLFLVAMGSLFGDAVPGAHSSGMPGPVLVGIVALAAGIGVALFGVWALRHRPPSDIR